MSILDWEQGSPIFPSCIGHMDRNKLATYIGELESTLLSKCRRLVEFEEQASVADIVHEPVDLGAMKPPAANSTHHPYQDEVVSLLARLLGAGFELRGVDDGEVYRRTGTLESTLEAILGVDESMLRLCLDGKRHGKLFLVLGNEPGVVVSDYSDPDLDFSKNGRVAVTRLEQVLDAHYEAWSK